MRPLIVLSILALILSPIFNSAQAELLCAKKSLTVGAEKARTKKAFKSAHHDCPAGYKELGSVHQVIASARVDNVPAVLNFGGFGTTGAAVSRPSTGVYEVTFTGDYPGLDSSDPFENLHRTVVLTTAESNSYGITSAEVLSASTTEIVISVSLIDGLVPDLQDHAGIHIAVFEADHLGAL